MAWHEVVYGFDGYSKVGRKHILLAKRGWVRTVIFWFCAITIYLIPLSILLWVINGFKLRFHSVKEKIQLEKDIVSYSFDATVTEKNNDGARAAWAGIAAHNFRKQNNITTLFASYMVGNTPSVIRTQKLTVTIHLVNRKQITIVIDDKDRKKIIDLAPLNLSEYGREMFYAMFDDIRVYKEIASDIQDYKEQLLHLTHQAEKGASYEIRQHAKAEHNQLKREIEQKVAMLDFYDAMMTDKANGKQY